MTDEELARLKDRAAALRADRFVLLNPLEALALIAEVERLRGELAARNVCWHCKVCLQPEVQHCASCPAECDNEDCQAEGCQEAAAHPDDCEGCQL